MNQPAARPASNEPRLRSTRDEALDLVKGLLVVWMLVYHWLNYFTEAGDWVYRLLRPVTPSFIFIAGYLAVRLALAAGTGTTRATAVRLLARGVRLLLLFTALNLGLLLLEGRGVPLPQALTDFVRQAPALYLGTAGGGHFLVLVPIAYAMAVAPLFLWLLDGHQAWAFAATAACIVFVAVAEHLGVPSGHLFLFSFGLLGLCAGTVNQSWLERSSAIPWALVAAFACYLVAVFLWNVRFSVQIVGVPLTLLGLYAVGRRWRRDGTARRAVLLMGQYTLFAYLLQIAVLQLLKRLVFPAPLDVLWAVLPFALALGGMLALTALTREARRRATSVDRLYRAVLS